MITTRACVLLVTAIITANAQSLQSELEGKRLVGKNSKFGGIEFKNKSTILIYEEESGNTPVAEARVRWITEDIFFAVEKGPESSTCAPRTWIYRVVRRSKETISLHWFWTGWAPSEDPLPTYRLLDHVGPEGAPPAP